MRKLLPVPWFVRGAVAEAPGVAPAVLPLSEGAGRVALGLPRDIDDEEQAEFAAQIRALLRGGALAVGGEEFVLLEETFPRVGTAERRTRRCLLLRLRVAGSGAATVLRHEKVFERAIADRVRVNLEARMSMAPLLLTYRDAGGAVARVLEAAEPRGAFVDASGTHVRVLGFGDGEALAQALEGLSFVIADGHHRYAAAVQTHASLVAEGSPSAEDAAFVLAALVEEADPGLVIEPTHRVVSGLANFSFDALVEDISPWVRVTPAEPEAEPAPGRVLAVVPGRGDFIFALRDPSAPAHPNVAASARASHGLDVTWLQGVVIRAALGLEPGTPAWRDHVRFLTGEFRPELRDLARDAHVLFALAAPPPGIVRAVAEAHDTLPQKSTAYHPKAPAGLSLHHLGALL